MKQINLKGELGALFYFLVLFAISLGLWSASIPLLDFCSNGCGLIITNFIGLAFAFIMRKKYLGDMDELAYYFGTSILGLTMPILYGLMWVVKGYVNWECKIKKEENVESGDE